LHCVPCLAVDSVCDYVRKLYWCDLEFSKSAGTSVIRWKKWIWQGELAIKIWCKWFYCYKSEFLSAGCPAGPVGQPVFASLFPRLVHQHFWLQGENDFYFSLISVWFMLSVCQWFEWLMRQAPNTHRSHCTMWISSTSLQLCDLLFTISIR